MRNTLIIIKKQLMDTLKNKTILIQFILFPVMTLIMENTVRLEGMPELFFAKLFSIMYMGMAPLTATAAIISEEKEKDTLRVLMMANVAPWQYLAGVGIYVWSVCMAGAAVMATGFAPGDLLFYCVVMGVGFFISVVLGGCVGMFAKNQIMATSVVIPVMAVLSFAPMLSLFNDTVKKFSGFLYTRQLSALLENMTFGRGMAKSAGIVIMNAAVCVLLFFIIFKRRGLE